MAATTAGPDPNQARGAQPPTIVVCGACGLAQRVLPIDEATICECSRCGTLVSRPMHDSLRRTAAFSLAALALYVPANVYPILRMSRYGRYSESTVWEGCVTLFRDHQWLVAGIVFAASILIPLCKLLALFFLVTTVKLGWTGFRRERSLLHRFVLVIGPWAMLDVFLLAVLVALVRLRQLATVRPGPGLLAFTAVVVFSVLASASFDPRLIFRGEEPLP